MEATEKPVRGSYSKKEPRLLQEEPGFNKVKLDLRIEEDLDTYWNRLEYVCVKM